jgi:outer membrane protein OmpA-like peptidoglycan-associated protein
LEKLEDTTMSSSNDDEATRYGLMVVAGVIGLVVVGVLAFAVGRLGGSSPAAASSAVAMPTPVTAPAAMEAGFAPPEKLYFAVGSDALPADSDAVLARVAEAARAQNGVSVLISGFHDATGNAQMNADLAKRRAFAVRHALEAYGVSPERLVMSRPELTTGGADDKEARRVELRLR